jgi:hypothetical protein
MLEGMFLRQQSRVLQRHAPTVVFGTLASDWLTRSLIVQDAKFGWIDSSLALATISSLLTD